MYMKKREKKSTNPLPQPSMVAKSATLRNRRYTISELLQITGMTRRQAVYWAQIGLLTPKMRNPKAAGRQPTSFYSVREVVKALIICDLLKRGISLQQVQRLARYLEKHGIRLDESEDYLITNGPTVIFAQNGAEAIDILKHQGQMLLVPIHEKVEKLRNIA